MHSSQQVTYSVAPALQPAPPSPPNPNEWLYKSRRIAFPGILHWALLILVIAMISDISMDFMTGCGMEAPIVHALTGKVAR